MAHTPLFSQLRRLMRTAHVSQATGVSASELLQISRSRRCIGELGYGTNAKVIAGVKSRPWRVGNASGNVFSGRSLCFAVRLESCLPP